MFERGTLVLLCKSEFANGTSVVAVGLRGFRGYGILELAFSPDYFLESIMGAPC
jgi:hypothetical protein